MNSRCLLFGIFLKVLYFSNNYYDFFLASFVEGRGSELLKFINYTVFCAYLTSIAGWIGVLDFGTTFFSLFFKALYNCSLILNILLMPPVSLVILSILSSIPNGRLSQYDSNSKYAELLCVPFKCPFPSLLFSWSVKYLTCAFSILFCMLAFFSI